MITEEAAGPAASVAVADPGDSLVEDPTADAGQAGSVLPPRASQGTDADELEPLYLLRASLLVLATAALTFALEMMLVSGLQHRVAQQGKYGHFRKVLALGTAPVSQTDPSGHLLALGTPVALLDIPSIHVHQVVSEGTTAGLLMSGPGHRRDTALPGQAGTSIIMGRQATFGGPFRRLYALHRGAHIIVTTGQGVSTFEVTGQRRGGDPAPPLLPSGKGRLTLITARGTPYMPTGVLRVDADLVTPTLATPPLVLPVGGLPHAEQAMAVDAGTVWALVLWLEALIIVAVGGVWSWIRWGRHQTWIVFLPATALVGLFVADQFARLLPNLL